MSVSAKAKAVKRKYKIYANGTDEYVSARNVDAALRKIRRRMIQRFGMFVLGGVEMEVNGTYKKIM